jgi:stage V sporulation protein D (sporulation-specific penicillin-binding protein)
MKSNYRARIRVISIFIFIFALLIISRLYFLQIVDNDKYLDKAARQYSSTAKNIFSRGSIFFENKDGTLVSAATLKSGFVIAINPEILKDPESVWQKVNSIMPTDHDSFLAKASKIKDPYEEIAVRQEEAVGEQITALKIQGLQAIKDRWRFYPGGDTAAHVIGLLGYKGDDYAGRYGLEKQYDGNLERQDGGYVNFFAQIFAGIKTATASTTKSEADVVTTIEPVVESYLETLLASTTEKWNSDETGGIIMNPNTGEIYAMEVYPTFDPNHPELQKNVSVFSNPLIEDVFEMGSIIKPLTISAGIDAGVITAHSTYYDGGFITVNGQKIRNFDNKIRGIVSMQDVLSQSLNVGAAHAESLLGNELFTKYMYAFGLNQKTGIELPNEGKNLTKNLESPRDIEHVTASFGQGIALTSISTIRALATVANGGVLVKPHVVKSIDYKIGIDKNTAIGTYPRVLKQGTSEEVTRMLVYSVDNVLSGGKLKIPNYSVAAKTGTAQIAKEGGGGYYEDQFLHTFIGYFPAYNPQFIIFLFTKNPKGAQFGSETLTVPFMNTVKFLINYYEVSPDR